MNQHPDPHDDPARRFTRLMRGLPPRRAPATLESRVLGELRRRTVQPWRSGFSRWPPGARVAFVVVCGALAGTTLNDASWVSAAHTVSDVGAAPAWLQSAAAAVTSAGNLGAVLAHAIPAGWLYAGLGAGATLYALLFGLGAAAYRTLYIAPSTSGDLQ